MGGGGVVVRLVPGGVSKVLAHHFVPRTTILGLFPRCLPHDNVRANATFFLLPSADPSGAALGAQASAAAAVASAAGQASCSSSLLTAMCGRGGRGGSEAAAAPRGEVGTVTPASPSSSSSGASGLPPSSSSPFCAVTKEVVTAFAAQQQQHDEQQQKKQQCPGSPGSAFRQQPTVIETSSSEVEVVHLPTAPASAGQCLAMAISTPSPPLPPSTTAPAALAPAAPGALGSLGSCPAHGVKAVCGKRNKMEDMYAVQPNFFDIPLSPTSDDAQSKLPQRIALQLEADCSPSGSLTPSPCSAAAHGGAGTGTAAGGGAAAASEGGDQGASACGSDAGLDTLHFFGVYDGHGGCQAAEHCAKRLHHHLSLALATACGCLVADGNQMLQAVHDEHGQADWSISSTLIQSVASFAVLGLGGGAAAGAGDSAHQHFAQGAAALPPVLPRSPLSRASFTAVADAVSSSVSSSANNGDEHSLFCVPEGELAFDNDSSGTGSDRSDGNNVSSLLEDALKDAFVRTDAEFANDGCAAMVGSTALVALVGTRKIWLANCGGLLPPEGARAGVCAAAPVHAAWGACIVVWCSD